MSQNLVDRFLRWVVGAIAFAALLYVGGSLWVGMDKVGDALAMFEWVYIIPMALLTLTNYGLRFVKWHYLVRLLGVEMPLGENAWNFMSGLAMVISPGKAGELLKPYVVRARTGTPMATTIPALVGERITDGIAMLALAGIGITTYAADKVHYLAIPAAIIIVGLLVLSNKRLTMLCVDIVAKVPFIGRAAPKLREMVVAARVVLAPVPLVVSIALSLVAWFAECIAFWLTFKGLGVAASIEMSTFIYAFSTVAGAAMPGGLGVSDGAMAAGAVTLMGQPEGIAVAASLLVRAVTLWLGVFLGALALFKVSSMLGGKIELRAAPEAPPESAAP
jgi:glycosyltransferase 2 family protein